MSTSQQPEDERASVPDIIRSKPVAELPEHLRQGVEMTRQYTQVTGEIAAMQWGKGMTPLMRRAVSSWCERYGVDASTELDVLGGSFYLNSEFYLRKLGELRRSGIIADFWFEHIHNDPRLKALMDDEKFPQAVRDEARKRWTDMLFKRVEQNAPEEADAVCVCYIVLPQGGHPIKGCKWAGNGTSVKQPRQGGGASPNPIAEGNAELSVESQSARRAARQIVSHVTDKSIPNFDAMESELQQLSIAHESAIDAQEQINARLDAESHPPKALASSGMIGYDMAQPGGERVAVYRTGEDGKLALDEIKKIAELPDPYADGDVRVPAPNLFAQDIGLSAPIDGRAPRETPATPEEREAASKTASGEPTQCKECKNMIRPGQPSDHKAACNQYAD